MAETDMVGLGLSVFAIGTVAGWSALFLRWPSSVLSALGVLGIFAIWLLLVPGLAHSAGLPLPHWFAGTGSGLAAHLGLRHAISSKRVAR